MLMLEGIGNGAAGRSGLHGALPDMFHMMMLFGGKKCAPS